MASHQRFDMEALDAGPLLSADPGIALGGVGSRGIGGGRF
jgi:hypothetical protein